MALCPDCHGPVMRVPCGSTWITLDLARRPGGDYHFDGRATYVGSEPNIEGFTAHEDTCPQRTSVPRGDSAFYPPHPSGGPSWVVRARR